MDVTLVGTKVTQNVNTFAFEKNNGVDVINVTVDTDESWNYKLDVNYSKKLCSGETGDVTVSALKAVLQSTRPTGLSTGDFWYKIKS